MKGKVEHIIPLTGSVILMLERAATFRSSSYVFPGANEGRPLSYVHDYAYAPYGC